MSHGLLNAQTEAAVCQRMIAAVEAQREIIDNTLKTRVLERGEYLRAIASRLALDSAVQQMHKIYNKEFHV